MKDERVASLAVAPNGRALLITTAIPNDRALATKIPNYVTETGYTEEINSRPKVGDFQSAGRIAFMALPSGEVRFLKVAADTTQTPSSASVLGWSDDGTRALLFSVSSDFKGSVDPHRYRRRQARPRRRPPRQRVGEWTVLRLRWLV